MISFIPWHKGNDQAKAGLPVFTRGIGRYSTDYYCLYLSPVPQSESGMSDPSTIDSTLKKSQKAMIYSSHTIEPTHGYRVMLDVNPALLEVADVRTPRIIEDGMVWQGVEVTALKNFDPNQLDYLVRAYLIR